MFGCAQVPESTSDPYAARMQQAAGDYSTCLTQEADKDAKNPAGAEDIATAAHGRCWLQWDAYREVTNATFSSGARTREEMQLAHDKADAHLRQFELEARRNVVDRIVQRTLTKKATP
jgi:hypothetical protein